MLVGFAAAFGRFNVGVRDLYFTAEAVIPAVLAPPLFRKARRPVAV